VVLYVIQSMMGGSDAEAGNLVGTGIGGSYDPSGVAASEGELNYLAKALQEAGEPELAQKILKIVENPDDVRNFQGVDWDAKRIIRDGIEAMKSQGIEVDGAGELIDKAQEVVDNLPELTQQAQGAVDQAGDTFVAKFKIGKDIQAAQEHADAAAQAGIKGDSVITSRVRKNGYIYSTATPK
jgi:hypothetical protein